jgi:hypothetical protein
MCAVRVWIRYHTHTGRPSSDECGVWPRCSCDGCGRGRTVLLVVVGRGPAVSMMDAVCCHDATMVAGCVAEEVHTSISARYTCAADIILESQTDMHKAPQESARTRTLCYEPTHMLFGGCCPVGLMMNAGRGRDDDMITAGCGHTVRIVNAGGGLAVPEMRKGCGNDVVFCTALQMWADPVAFRYGIFQCCTDHGIP